MFEVALANRAGRTIERKRLTRRPFERFLEALAPGTAVVMEACGTAHGGLKPVAVKTVEPQTLLALHRVRSQP